MNKNSRNSNAIVKYLLQVYLCNKVNNNMAVVLTLTYMRTDRELHLNTLPVHTVLDPSTCFCTGSHYPSPWSRKFEVKSFKVKTLLKRGLHMVLVMRKIIHFRPQLTNEALFAVLLSICESKHRWPCGGLSTDTKWVRHACTLTFTHIGLRAISSYSYDVIGLSVRQNILMDLFFLRERER